MPKFKRYFYLLLHILFITGLMYAFTHFIQTPRSDIELRRLWAYENWIILSFYSLFVYLTVVDVEINGKKIQNAMKKHTAFFKRILLVNVILLIFPWGIFLLIAPHDLMEKLRLSSFYWRILGGLSLLAAAIYYYPYRFYKYRLTYYILAFGAIDNMLAGIIVTILFLTKSIPLIAWSVAPLLFYYSFFFLEETRKYKDVSKFE